MVTPQLSCDDPIIPELQAVVLAAGPGSRVTDISLKRAKCLIPIANRPLLFYPLKELEKAGFTDVIIVIPENAKKEIPEKINRYFEKMNIEYFAVAEQLGTADSLRLIADKIKTDVLIISCDTITDYPLLTFINDFRKHDATLTCLLADAQQFTCVGKAKDKTEKDLIGLNDENKSQIIFLNSEADFSENVSIKRSMINQCPNFIINRNLLDAHVYIFKRWIIDYVVHFKNITSIKGELLPLLVQEQFVKVDSDLKPFYKSNDGLNQKHELLTLCLGNYSSTRDVICRSHKIDQGLCVRANNVTSFLEANKFIAQNPIPWNLNPTKIRGVNDSVVGKEINIGDKTTVRRCVIGKKCLIGTKIKLQDSVVMQKSDIEDGCTIENSVVCSGAKVGKNCVIKNSIVTMGYHLNEGEKHANDVIGKHLDDIEL